MKYTFVKIALAVAVFVAALPRDSRPRRIGRNFAGRWRTAFLTNPNLPDSWSATENVAWKAAIPGRGWSSPIVWGTRSFSPA